MSADDWKGQGILNLWEKIFFINTWFYKTPHLGAGLIKYSKYYKEKQLSKFCQIIFEKLRITW